MTNGCNDYVDVVDEIGHLCGKGFGFQSTVSSVILTSVDLILLTPRSLFSCSRLVLLVPVDCSVYSYKFSACSCWC